MRVGEELSEHANRLAAVCCCEPEDFVSVATWGKSYQNVQIGWLLTAVVNLWTLCLWQSRRVRVGEELSEHASRLVVDCAVVNL